MNDAHTPFLVEEMISQAPSDGKTPSLLLPLGRSEDGAFHYADLEKLPHLFLEGSAGSGKSVFLHTCLQMLQERNPEGSLRFLVLDPKGVEFASESGKSSLLLAASQETIEIASAHAVEEMEDRYGAFESEMAATLAEYNEKAKDPIPALVILVDEWADLPKKAKDALGSLLAKGRAAGIHVIAASQLPLEGKALMNFPVRIEMQGKGGFEWEALRLQAPCAK